MRDPDRMAAEVFLGTEKRMNCRHVVGHGRGGGASYKGYQQLTLLLERSQVCPPLGGGGGARE